MKIVQTYWTKPMFKKSGELYNRIKGGWSSHKHAICAMVYSCLSLKRFYPQIELVTDDWGYKLLIEELGLPYSSVNLALNDFDVDPNLWALAKVYSYGLQDEPFIHVDNDVFIWEKLPDRIENAPICCQNFEVLADDYQEGLQIIRNHTTKDLSLFHKLAYTQELNKYSALNAGVLGGNNVKFIQDYSAYTLNFFNSKSEELLKVGESLGLLNIVLEQLSIGYLCRQNNIRVECLKNIEDFDELINNIIDIYSAPIRTKYVHCLGDIKKDFGISEQIEFHLKKEFPEYYQKVVGYCTLKGYETAIDSNSFRNFKITNHLMSLFQNVDSLMGKVKFRIHPRLQVIMKNNRPFLRTPSNDQPMIGWGKIMLYMNGYKTGNQIANDMFDDLKDFFSKEEIQENVFYYLLHTLYMGYVVPSVNC